MFPFDSVFFFFKQKTAYEMRISDWSSDVCSSDLRLHHRQRADAARHGRRDRESHGAFGPGSAPGRQACAHQVGKAGRGEEGAAEESRNCKESRNFEEGGPCEEESGAGDEDGPEEDRKTGGCQNGTGKESGKAGVEVGRGEEGGADQDFVSSEEIRASQKGCTGKEGCG